MFRLREGGVGQNAEKGVAPDGSVLGSLQAEITRARAATIVEPTIDRDLRAIAVPAQNPDNTAAVRYNTVTIHPDLHKFLATVRASSVVSLDQRPNIDHDLAAIIAAGHNSLGTKAEADASIQIIDRETASLARYNTSLVTQTRALGDFTNAISAETTAQQSIDNKSQLIGQNERHDPIAPARTPYLRATLIAPQELVHSSFFDEISHNGGNREAFDRALARVPDVNVKNAKFHAAITYVAKNSFEYGIAQFLARGARTSDTFIFLFKERLEEATRLLMRLVAPIPGFGYNEIFQGLMSDHTVTHLDLASCTALTLEGIATLTSALKHNHSVIYLDLSRNNIGEGGAEQIGDLLTHNDRIICLKLSNTSMKDSAGIDCTSHIANALVHNTSIKELDLSGSNIPYEGGIAMARMLSHNTTMRVLDISNNNIEDVGIFYLLSDLTDNKHIVSVNFSNTGITDDGALAIAEWLADNCSVVRINISANRIGLNGIEATRAILDAVDGNDTILEFIGIEDLDGRMARKITANLDVFRGNLDALQHMSFEQVGDGLFKKLFILHQQIISKVAPIALDEISLLTQIRTICAGNHIEDSTDPYATELVGRFEDMD